MKVRHGQGCDNRTFGQMIVTKKCNKEIRN